MERAWRWRIALGGVACLVVMLLAVGGWRLVNQEQSLQRERTRERLENASSLVIRESERALARDVPTDGMSVAWDEQGLRRIGGVALAWSPSPIRLKEASAEIFAAGERFEFASNDAAGAIAEYQVLLGNANTAVRAGALVRIARCQRKLGKTVDALTTYERLEELGAAPAGGAPAELVALRERAALLEPQAAIAAERERERLREALEQGRYALDRTTFAFYAQSAHPNEQASAWAEAVEEMWKRSRDYARGAEVLAIGSRHFAAEWSREGNGGSGRLVDIAAIEHALAGSIRLPGLSWQFLDGAGKRLAGSPVEAVVKLRRVSAETGLPWTVVVSLPREGGYSQASLAITGLLVSGLAIFAALWLAYRAVQRQLHVARMQSEFVAAVSHEFRTPITALTHLTEILESGGAPEERKPAYYAALGRETARLREMVEALLDFGRLESGRYRYKAEPLDLADFVSSLVDEFRQQPAGSTRVVVFQAGSRPHPVSADRATLRRAVWNLLDNAAKYSPPGKPVIAEVHSTGNCAGVSVQDEGPGIPVEEQKTIFQKFVRGRAARDSEVKGAGIGLAMVDAIARAHGGRVELNSRPGEGSRFTILLPTETPNT